jgi:hypothetical protein
MPVELRQIDRDKVVEVKATGTLTVEDYRQFLPEVERLVKQHGPIRILFEMHDFHGWTAGAAWQDFKFGVTHFDDVERLAMVGEKKWQKLMAMLCRPFTKARIRYFDASQAAEARTWITAAKKDDPAPP